MSTVTRPGSPCLLFVPGPTDTQHTTQEPHVTQMRNLTCRSYVLLIVDTRNITVGPLPGNVRSQLLWRALPDLPLCSLPSRGRRGCAGAETAPPDHNFALRTSGPIGQRGRRIRVSVALAKTQVTDGAEGCFPATTDRVRRRRQARMCRGHRGTWAATRHRRSRWQRRASALAGSPWHPLL
jgi:hypothetical protein